jgi:hypothetical protein
MYRCEICGRVVPLGTPAIRQVVETRDREYPRRRDDSDVGRKGRKRSSRSGDAGGAGREIVRERLVCGGCAEPEEPPG